MCKISSKKNFIKYNKYFLILLLELQKCEKALQIKIIFCWAIISFICALISQHNARLGHKPSSITEF